jgi:threonine/homoserine/homoserine lactone efflux protein
MQIDALANLAAFPALAPFAAASLALAVSPGPGVLFIVAHTLAHGRRAGLRAVAGVAAGNAANAVAASLGLAAVFAAWPPAYTAVRLAGGLVLIAMAWMAWRRPAPGGEAGPGSDAPGGKASGSGPAATATSFPSTTGQAFWVALLNPKTTLFFAALLPPFLDPAGSAVAQSLALSAVFVLIAAATDSLYALAASAAAPRLSGGAALGRWVAAAVYLGLGVWAVAGAVAGP